MLESPCDHAYNSQLMYIRLLTLLRLSALVLLLNACSRQDAGDDYESINERLATLAADLNKHLPDMADENTVLERTTGSNQQFSYYYTLLNYNADDIDVDAFIKQMKPQLQQSACNSDLLRPLVSRGVTIQYSYADQERNEFAIITIPATLCRNT